jgi:inhibitor of KinA
MANPLQLIFFPISENCMLIQFDSKEEYEVHLGLKKLLKILETPINGVNEIVPGLDSIAVFYDPIQIGRQTLEEQISQLSAQSEMADIKANHWKIPVCYDTSFGIDLELVAANANLSIDDVIKIHSNTTYEVLMLGFLPGFAYLGNVDNSLRIPRKASPRQQVSAGSIAIADEMTGIYGAASPGGWHILGRTPLPIFDINQNPPNFLKQGDTVSFQSISLDEFESILKKGSHEL